LSLYPTNLYGIEKRVFPLKILIPNMTQFAAKCEFFAQEYDMWFVDHHKGEARLKVNIFAFGRTDLCHSELFLKAISRAKR